jgi:NADPH:quinone reductase-like Zn-dependent oxidoreductase
MARAERVNTCNLMRWIVVNYSKRDPILLRGNERMKAIVWTNYGPPDVLQLKEVEKPTPRDNEVLIKVHAATVTAGDCEVRSLKIPLLFHLPIRLYAGLRKPKRITVLGQELAGEIEAVGKDITRFQKGDPVFGPTFFRFGAYAEYACLPEAYLVWKPANVTYEEAATIPTGGVNGLHFVRTANVQPGEKVLINGAGGSIGTYAVQIAKAFGAEVTAVDSAEKLDMLRTIGADHVMDYTQEDFTRNGESYDVIIDVAGKSPFSRSLRSLNPKGRYILGNASLLNMVRARWTPMNAEKKVMVALASYKTEDYTVLKELLQTGKIKPAMDRCFPLEQTAEAHRYVENGHKKGNVVITMKSNA